MYNRGSWILPQPARVVFYLPCNFFRSALALACVVLVRVSRLCAAGSLSTYLCASWTDAMQQNEEFLHFLPEFCGGRLCFEVSVALRIASGLRLAPRTGL